MAERLAREDFVLAVLSTAEGAAFTPVQVQKLFFLLDARASAETGGPYFDFKPYDYGPFDVNVYNCLDTLAARGCIAIDRSGYVRTYRVTPAGLGHGKRWFERLSDRGRAFAARCAQFVREHSFASLVSAIYQEFPDMRQNSVFRDPA